MPVRVIEQSGKPVWVPNWSEFESGSGSSTSLPYINADETTGGLAAAVATGKNVVFESDYSLGSTILELAEGQRIISYGGTVSFTGGYAMILASGSVVEGVTFSGADGVSAFKAIGGVENMTIRNCHVLNCQLLKTQAGVDYTTLDWDTKESVPKNIYIDGCTGAYTLDTQSTSSCIVAQFVDGLYMNGGRYSGYKYGVYYWGGNSDPSSQGDRANQRKVDNIVVSNVVFDNCWQAAAWGSMGINAMFIGCTAWRDTVGGDVCFDHEGTVTGKTISCSARNYQNGNYATFFEGGTHEIIGCSSIQPGGYPHYRNYNSSNDPANGAAVLIDGCVFSRDPDDTTATLGSIDTANGPARHLIVQNCRLQDTRIATTATNNGDVDIRNNNQSLTTTPSAAVQMIRTNVNAGSNFGDTNINGNTLVLRSGVSWVSGSSYIYAVTANYNQSRSVRIFDNKGPGSVAVTESGGNSGVSGIYYIYNNVVTGVTYTNSGSKNLLMARADGNYTNAGALITVS